jgi:hypothetical protein
MHIAGDGALKAFFHNAKERFESGRVLQTTDSLFILLDPFDNELAFRITGDSMTGLLRRRDGKGPGLPVRAIRGLAYRFPSSGIKPEGDLTGTYDIVFSELTHLREGHTTFDFSFPDVYGRLVSLHDQRYKNKVVIVTIGGTWCPNCMDEASFLTANRHGLRAAGLDPFP